MGLFLRHWRETRPQALWVCFAGKLRDAYRALVSNDTPDRLQSQPSQVMPLDADTCLVSTYSAVDPLRVPMELIRVLHYFDGRPIADDCTAIMAERRISLTPALLRRLTDIGVLAPE